MHMEVPSLEDHMNPLQTQVNPSFQNEGDSISSNKNEIVTSPPKFVHRMREHLDKSRSTLDYHEHDLRKSKKESEIQSHTGSQSQLQKINSGSDMVDFHPSNIRNMVD